MATGDDFRRAAAAFRRVADDAAAEVRRLVGDVAAVRVDGPVGAVLDGHVAEAEATVLRLVRCVEGEIAEALRRAAVCDGYACEVDRYRSDASGATRRPVRPAWWVSER